MQNKTALIVYATVHGQAELVARRIAEAASDWHVDATVQNVRKTGRADLERYGSIILVASVHYGRHQRSISRFVRRNRERLARMHSAFISVSGDAGDPSTRPRAEEYVREFFRLTGWTAAEHQVIGGAVKFTRYNVLLRYMTRRALAAKGVQLDPHRDYEYTDWELVLRFARAFLSEPDARVAPGGDGPIKHEQTGVTGVLPGAQDATYVADRARTKSAAHRSFTVVPHQARHTCPDGSIT